MVLAGKLHLAACVVRPGRYFVCRLLQVNGDVPEIGVIGRRSWRVGEDEEEGGAERVFGLTPEFMADMAW